MKKMKIELFIVAIFALFALIAVPSVSAVPCNCGDICVNEIGWWCDGGAFNPSGTSIQDAIANAGVCCDGFTCAGPCTICVKDGTYTENVDVTTANLTIKSENGSASTTVTAVNHGDHVFNVEADCVNITGFTVKGATGQNKAGIFIKSGLSNCNISNNNVSNNYYGISYNNPMGLTIDHCEIRESGKDGINGRSDSGGVRITNNNVYDNDGHGIYIPKGSFLVNATTGTSDDLSNNRLVNNSKAAYFLGTNIYPTPGAEIMDNGFNGIKGLADYDVTRTVTVSGTYKLDLWLWDQYAGRAVTIEKDAILTIAPGVKVQMQGGREIEVKNGGSLIANGTSDSHITFTADSGSPSRGHWDYIYFCSGSSGSLKYCDIEWGGGSNGAVYYNNPAAGSLTIDHCEIRESKTNGIRGRSTSGGVTITNNNVHDSDNNGIYIESGTFPVNATTGTSDDLSNNRLVNNSVAAYHLCTNIYPTPGEAEVNGNGFDGIRGLAGSEVSVSGTYKMPLYLWVQYPGQHHRLTINPGATVTISPGQRVQIQRTIGIQVKGSLIAEGTESEHIIFTADIASPNRGHWDYIYFGSGSSGSLKYCDIEWGGDSSGAVYYYNPAAGSLTIDHCEIRESGKDGINGRSTSGGVTITNNNVHDNTENGINIKRGSFPVNGTTGTADNLSNNRLVNNSGAAYHLYPNIYPTPGSAEVSGNRIDGIRLDVGSDVTTVSGTYKMPLYLWVEYPGQHHRLTINSGATVTIAPGLRVQIQRTIGIKVEGSLIAEGTESEHISFTADSGSPSRGHWDYIYFGSGSSGILRYCDIEWGGGNSGAVYYYNPAGLTIDHCEIRESKTNGISGRSTSGGVTITNNNVHDSDNNGIYIESGSFPANATTDTSDDLSNNRLVNNSVAAYHLCTNIYPTPGEAEVSGNGFDGIRGLAGSEVSVSGTYKMPLYLWVQYPGQHHRLTINPGATVTIPPGQRVQIQRTIGIDVKGSLIAEGTSDSHITFTADSGSPSRGHWDYIYFCSGSSGSLRYCDIEWGGGSSGAVYYYSPSAGSLTIDDCEIRESGSHGIRGTSSSGGVTITACKIHENTDHGISISNSHNTIINGCTINNNTRGIDLSGSNNNNISTNIAESNEQGIYLTTSSSNLIYNNFFNNTNNAYDNSGTNIWNISKRSGTNIIDGPYLGGNYWSDYLGRDLDGDELGDTDLPYNAYGDIQQGGDWHPLVERAPDLVISNTWVCPGNCTICYNVTNIGNEVAPACHHTTLYVDGVAVAHDHVPVDLEPGESYVGCFDGYTWQYSPPGDNITVCADNNETIDELDETNNCLTNIWMCGDVNCDGRVTMSDVRKVFNRYLDPNYPLDLPWAADVNCDGKVTMSDVRKVFNRYLDPSYDLNCCCEGVG